MQEKPLALWYGCHLLVQLYLPQFKDFTDNYRKNAKVKEQILLHFADKWCTYQETIPFLEKNYNYVVSCFQENRAPEGCVSFFNFFNNGYMYSFIHNNYSSFKIILRTNDN